MGEDIGEGNQNLRILEIPTIKIYQISVDEVKQNADYEKSSRKSVQG